MPKMHQAIWPTESQSLQNSEKLTETSGRPESQFMLQNEPIDDLKFSVVVY